jgi:hypothetical protein
MGAVKCFPGHRAGILVVDADPTQNIWNARRITGLIVDGNVVNRDGAAESEALRFCAATSQRREPESASIQQRLHAGATGGIFPFQRNVSRLCR